LDSGNNISIDTGDRQISVWRRQRINVLRLSVLLFIPLVLVVQPSILIGSAAHALLDSLGIMLILAGIAGRFWCIIHIGGRKSRLVLQDGPYSICRHPLYLFSTVATVGIGLTFGSILLAAGLGLVVLCVLYVTARHEERYLIAHFGEDYRAYARRVPRLIPSFGLWRSQAEIRIDTGALYGNFRDALVLMSFIPLSRFLVWLRETYDLGLVQMI
jgi:protein-S-isoprenylcysteine O-methyltransferase Ste14